VLTRPQGEYTKRLIAAAPRIPEYAEARG
jgi:hypothetical protein